MRGGQHLEAFSTGFGLAVSAALHIAALAYVASVTASYDFDFELTLPTEVEFGVADGAELSVGGHQASSPSGGTTKSARSPASDAIIIDAGVPNHIEDTAADTDAATATATAPESLARIPPGAHLALRIDMKRVRESPLGPDVTQFLRGVPDWQLIVAGSGIDPVDDLDRLLIATPNLQRSKLVLAGEHHGDRELARTSVKRLARARGKSVRWQRRFGVPTARWYNRDKTARTIALLSERHFSITRKQDVERILALTKAREMRDAKAEGLVEARGADALLSMGPEEALSLEVEGVHRFVVGSVKHVPTRLRVAVRETGADEATVTALATYASPEDAREAAEYWKKVASFYSKQLVLSLAGFGKTLRRMELGLDGERVALSFKLDADQIRFILSYAEGRLRGAGGATQPKGQREEW
jgi:hypothetical protein